MKISVLTLLRTNKRILLTMIMPAMFFLLLAPGASHAAFSGKVEIQSIQIRPFETPAGKHPEIIGTIKASSAKVQGKAISAKPGEAMEVNVIASLVRPDNVLKSWTWKKIWIKAGEAKGFSIPKEYDVKLKGVYKLDFGVYSKDMRPLHRMSKRFTVVAPSRSSVMTTSPQTVSGTNMSSGKTSSPQADDRNIGLGVSANAVNTAGGVTLLYWPFKNVGLQASYTMGTFTTAEGRLLARFPLSSKLNPYLGIGYASVTTERTVDVIGIKTTFTDTGVSGVIGVEIPLSKSMSGYVEISGAGIDLKKEITNGVQTGTATVKYSPLTVGFSIVYFLF